jgi:FkbM family methyltransferase
VGSSRSDAVRGRIAVALVTLLDYSWRMAELHLRRQLPRRRHWVAMRLFQVFGRSFPVTLANVNLLRADRRPLRLCFDLCQNHEIYVRARGRYEVEWLRLVAAGLEDAEAFVDVGANVGVYALTVAHAFPDRRVIAVEPLPENLDKLRRAAALNALDNVTIVPGVVTTASGRIAFHVNPLSDGGGSLVPFTAYQTGDVVRDAATYRRAHPGFVPTVDVETVTLDSLVTGRTVLKVDVEGAEESVLRSGERALAKGLVDVIVVEVQTDTFAPVVGLLDDLDFDCFLYGRRRPLRPDDAGQLPYRVGNVLALRRGSRAHGRVDFL